MELWSVTNTQNVAANKNKTTHAKENCSAKMTVSPQNQCK
jgi:hypothetical protein